jgi:hypothetical protein
MLSVFKGAVNLSLIAPQTATSIRGIFVVINNLFQPIYTISIHNKKTTEIDIPVVIFDTIERFTLLI